VLATKPQILVLGAGVIGLTTACHLQNLGYGVEILAEKFSPHTTSEVAAAIWYPYKADPLVRVREWAMRTLSVLHSLENDPASGVRSVTGRKVFHRPMGLPWWKEGVRDFRRLSPGELPDGTVAGYLFSVPVADTSRYVGGYLTQRFLAAGGTFRRQKLNALGELAHFPQPIVINCTGLGARAWLGDSELFPIRGQILRVGKPYPDRFHLDTDHPEGPCYVVPRENDCILGGTSEKGEDSLDWCDRRGEAIAARIHAQFPELAGSPVLSRAVGLRPGRTAVRLERESTPVEGKTLIHNYGHGGAGITLSWGCAEEVAGLIG